MKMYSRGWVTIVQGDDGTKSYLGLDGFEGAALEALWTAAEAVAPRVRILSATPEPMVFLKKRAVSRSWMHNLSSRSQRLLSSGAPGCRVNADRRRSFSLTYENAAAKSLFGSIFRASIRSSPSSQIVRRCGRLCCS